VSDPQPFDDFMDGANPDDMNDREYQLYQERKAQAAAEEAQLRATKSSEVPTIEMLCADMIRVASDPETNPFHADKILSAKRYRRFGHFPFSYVESEFGTFNHAKEVAGLADKVGSRLQKSCRANQSRREHSQRYQEDVLLPYLYDPVAVEGTGTELMLSISDTHAGYLDPFTWWSFLRACKAMDPDIILLNGDMIEGSSISRHPKVPGKVMSLQAEFDFFREMIRKLRELCPDAEIIWTAGNHGLDRLASYLTQVAPGLAGLDSMRIDQLAGLDEFDVKLAQGGSFVSPKGQEKDITGIKFHGFYVGYHGTALGQTPYLTELRNSGLSGQSGHVHRAGLAYATTEALGAHSWMSTPSSVVEECGRSYQRSRSIAWQRGFGVCYLYPETQRCHQFPVVLNDGWGACEGLVFTDPGIALPDPMKPWISDFHSEYCDF
jgi:hypothetical protein